LDSFKIRNFDTQAADLGLPFDLALPN